MSSRSDQIESLLHRAVQSVLQEGLHDPRVRGLVSVTKVTMSADLSEAVVHVSVLPSEHAELTMHGLRHAARHVRSRVGNAVALRRTPRLRFKLDESIRKASDVYAALADANPTADDPADDAEEMNR